MIFHAFVVVVVVLISYLWYKKKERERKLNWIPIVEGKPVIGCALELRDTTSILKTLTKYVKEYGGLYLMNIGHRKIFVVTDHELLKFVLSSYHILNKNKEYRFLQKWLGDGLLLAKETRWKKSRKILTPAFHFSILEQFIQVFETNGRIMVEQLEKEVDKDSVDIYPYVTLCTLDIICEAAMGVSIHAQTEKFSDYVFAVKEMCRITIERGFSPIKSFDFLYFLTQDYYKEKKYLDILHSHTQSVIDSRKKQLAAKGKQENENGQENGNVERKKKMAFLDLLLQTSVDGKPLPDEYIREEVDTFMFEGHDTTASAISFTFYCLATHPDVQKKALDEQRVIFGKDISRTATHQDLQDMKYLELVIKESLRLYPSVPFFGRQAHKDIEYKEGKIIPEGQRVMIYAFGVNRDPNVFVEPDRFDPSRFQDNDGTLPYSYIPFSAGPRNCIGQKFAMLEIKSTVSKILRHFELLPTSPEHHLILAAETVLKSRNGIRIKLRKRTWNDQNL